MTQRTITIDKAREILGADSQNLTNEEIANILDRLYALGERVINLVINKSYSK